MAKTFTTGAACSHLEIPYWRLGDMYRHKKIREPLRHGNLRMLGHDDLLAISAELTRMGVPHRVPESPLCEAS